MQPYSYRCYRPKQIVWVKQPKLPWWPARIVSQDEPKLKVQFFDNKKELLGMVRPECIQTFYPSIDPNTATSSSGSSKKRTNSADPLSAFFGKSDKRRTNFEYCVERAKEEFNAKSHNERPLDVSKDDICLAVGDKIQFWDPKKIAGSNDAAVIATIEKIYPRVEAWKQDNFVVLNKLIHLDVTHSIGIIEPKSKYMKELRQLQDFILIPGECQESKKKKSLIAKKYKEMNTALMNGDVSDDSDDNDDNDANDANLLCDRLTASSSASIDAPIIIETATTDAAIKVKGKSKRSLPSEQHHAVTPQTTTAPLAKKRKITVEDAIAARQASIKSSEKLQRHIDAHEAEEWKRVHEKQQQRDQLNQLDINNDIIISSFLPPVSNAPGKSDKKKKKAKNTIIQSKVINRDHNAGLGGVNLDWMYDLQKAPAKSVLSSSVEALMEADSSSSDLDDDNENAFDERNKKMKSAKQLTDRKKNSNNDGKTNAKEVPEVVPWQTRKTKTEKKMVTRKLSKPKLAVTRSRGRAAGKHENWALFLS